MLDGDEPASGLLNHDGFLIAEIELITLDANLLNEVFARVEGFDPMMLVVPLIVVTTVCLLLLMYLVSLYNNLVTKRNRFQNAFAQIDVQLKRRCELIPNLVEVVKGYMKHERETLEAVIAARNSAVSAGQQAAASPGSADAINKLSAAESTLTSSVSRLMLLAEAYPDLKANQNMISLQEELSSTENKVSFARQSFNDAVTSYNTACETFPGNMVAGFGRFEKASLFEITNLTEREAVKVKF